MSPINDEKYSELQTKYQRLKKEYDLVQNQLKELERSEQARHAVLYQYIPISIWEEDFSKVYNYIKDLDYSKYNDFSDYLNHNKDAIINALNLVKILDLNDHSARLYKLKDKKQLIERFEELFSESTLEAFRKELVAMHEGKKYIEIDGEITDVTGDKHDIFLQWFVLPGYESNYERVMITTIDVTEIKQAERERIKLLEQFQQKQKLESLGLFAGGIAHDFNNILFGISGHTELAMKNLPKNHDSYQFMEKVVQLISKASQITNQILSFAGKNTQTKDIVNVNSEFGKMRDLFSVFLNKTTQINLELAEEEIFVEINSGQLNQVMLNLVSNAAEAVKETTGIIDIKTEIVSQINGQNLNNENETYVLLTIRDNGIGIHPNDLKRLFDPFYTTKLNGRGLGLSVVHGIINSYNGVITVDSVLNEFTEFKIFLPTINKLPAKTYTKTEITSIKSDKQICVLVCEDEADIRYILKTFLNNQNYDVINTRNGEEGLERILENPNKFNILIVDINMPKMGGIEMLKRLEAENIFIPTILTSGYSNTNIKNLNLKTKTKLILKPYMLQSLMDIMTEILL